MLWCVPLFGMIKGRTSSSELIRQTRADPRLKIARCKTTQSSIPLAFSTSSCLAMPTTPDAALKREVRRGLQLNLYFLKWNATGWNAEKYFRSQNNIQGNEDSNVNSIICKPLCYHHIWTTLSPLNLNIFCRLHPTAELMKYSSDVSPALGKTSPGLPALANTASQYSASICACKLTLESSSGDEHARLMK